MTKRVDRHLAAQVQAPGDLLHGFLNRGSLNRCLRRCRLLVVPSLSGKQELRMTMGDPVPAKPIKREAWQWDVSVFGTLAPVDVDKAPLSLNVGDLQMPGFIEPQSHRIDSPQVTGDSVYFAGVDDLMDLVDGEHFGQRLGLPEFHRLQRLPVPLAGTGIEELDSREGDPLGSVGEVFLVLEVNEVGSELGFGDLVGASAGKVSQLPDGSEVSMDRSFGKTSEFEVFVHPLIELSVEEL